MMKAAAQAFMRRHRQAGFTLLEMLLVVALLAATAGMSLVMLGARDQQARYEETQRRLADVIRAVLGEPGAVWGGQMRLSGFVVDNGRLPLSLRELSDRQTLVDADECSAGGAVAAGQLACHKPRAPVFDPTPAASDGLDNASGDEITLNAVGERLPKGLRRYLQGRAGSPVWRDGWGNVSLLDDAQNYGWQLQLPASAAEPWVLRSLGSNNAVDAVVPDPDLDYVGELAQQVLAEDWRVDLSGWTVRVTNASGSVQPASGAALGLSLLLWRNDAGGGRWKRLSSELQSTPLPAGESRDFVFPATGYPGGALDAQVPLGEHLLLAFESANALAHDADDQPLQIGGRRISVPVRFYRGASRPVIELLLR